MPLTPCMVTHCKPNLMQLTAKGSVTEPTRQLTSDLPRAQCWWKPAFVRGMAPHLPRSLSPAEAATNCGLLCSSKQVAQGWSQQHLMESLPRSPEPTHVVTGPGPHQSRTQLAPPAEHPEGVSVGSRPCWGGFRPMAPAPHSSSHTVVKSVLTLCHMHGAPTEIKTK